MAYGPDRFCFIFLGGNSNESKSCGLRLKLDFNRRPEGLDLRPKDLDLRISESEDMDLPLWDLTTSLVAANWMNKSTLEVTEASIGKKIL